MRKRRFFRKSSNAVSVGPFTYWWGGRSGQYFEWRLYQGTFSIDITIGHPHRYAKWAGHLLFQVPAPMTKHYHGKAFRAYWGKKRAHA